MRKIANLVLVKLMVWEITGCIPGEIRKTVIIVAPHTSLYDFIIGRMAFWVLHQHVKFMINGKYFFWPLGWLLRSLGGVPVKRDKTTGLLLQLNQMYHENDDFHLVITPEGTRAFTNRWKKGFYQIAQSAEVPVYMAFIDYKNKKGGIGLKLEPSGNFQEDFAVVEAFYKQFHARHPERYNLNPVDE